MRFQMQVAFVSDFEEGKLAGRAIVVGRITEGEVRIGDKLRLEVLDRSLPVVGIEMPPEPSKEGFNIGIVVEKPTPDRLPIQEGEIIRGTVEQTRAVVCHDKPRTGGRIAPLEARRSSGIPGAGTDF